MAQKSQSGRKRSRHREIERRGAQSTRAGREEESSVISADKNVLLTTPRIGIALAVFAATAVAFWAYWPTFVELSNVWNTDPDYSHGYFVVPLAIYFLWARREQFPGVAHRHQLWPGIALLCAGVVLRFFAAAYYLEPVDGWSILLWVSGVVWLLGGWRWFRWALPSVTFLIFMVPLPFRVERMLSYPLQRIAAVISGWTLQCFRLPAIVQGNTIQLGGHTLEVEQACSGLTIFVGIAALSFAYVVLVSRSWWEKGLLLAAILPISLIANSARIVLTGLLYEFTTDETATRFSHDLAGWLMLPFAAFLFALTLWYLGRLFPRTQRLDVRDMLRQRESRNASQHAAT